MKFGVDYYDPDDDARPPSPLLVPTKINYKPEDTPPPYILSSASSARSGSSEADDSKDVTSAHVLARKKLKKKLRRKRNRARPSQGDEVLLRYLGPDRPDIAREGAQRPLNSASQSEVEDEFEEDMRQDGNKGVKNHWAKKDGSGGANAIELKSKACAALNDVAMHDDEEEEEEEEEEEDTIPSSEKGNLSASLTMHDLVNGATGKQRINGHSKMQVTCSDLLKSTASAAFDDIAMNDTPLKKQVVSGSFTKLNIAPLAKEYSGVNRNDKIQAARLDTIKDATESLHTPHLVKLVASIAKSKSETEDESLITSPALGKYTISPAAGDPDKPTLPAMQKSPPRPTSSNSPDGIHRLPSIKTALNMDPSHSLSPFSQNTAPSPTMSRLTQYNTTNSGLPSSIYPHPNPSPPKEMSKTSPPGFPTSASLWRSPISEGLFPSASPASLPTVSASPYSIQTEMSNADSIGQAQISSDIPPITGPFSSATFKCTKDGCNAPDFQTQYLLNSHMTVHSSDRPHFCPLKSCPRSIGGKGFKRKNEMIRHGLVHNSPGYVCPFCVDQQHRYPRPDNLLRHVKVHHKDKSRDDPQLRTVLAQRSGEGGRNRRRRATG